MHRKLSIQWFLLGLGSQLQVVFSLSISEVLVLITAPFLLVSEIPYMRRNGVMPFFWMAILLFCGCVVSLIVNHAQSYQVIRGVSITGIIVFAVVVGHYMLRSDPAGLKWFFIGVMLSGFLCIFVFQRSVEVAAAGSGELDAIMSGKLFWIKRLELLLTTPILAFYLEIPIIYSIGVPLFLALFSIMTSTSGRSASLIFLGAAVIVMFGRKKKVSIRAIGRHFTLYFCFAIVGVLIFKAIYQWAALNNYLGDEALTKYEQQTVGGSGIVQLLIGGRGDSFVGFLAIADSPIFGKGYWARDTEGYNEQFIAKYGTLEDYEHYRNFRKYLNSIGVFDRGIPCHSHITSFWLWYGLPGLLFWLYVIYITFRYLKNDAWAVPQWFYWLAAGIPGLMWNVLFSPFHSRVELPLYVVGILIARAVRLGKYQLPYEMIREIEEVERGK